MMKKVLLASTALVATSSYAFAAGHEGVSVSGSANAGVKFVEDAAQETALFYELDFNVTGVGTSDSGLEFGASLDLDLDADGDETSLVSDPEVFISGSFGTVTVGAPSPVSDAMGFGFSDPGFDGIGIDDAATTFVDNADADILYEFNSGALGFFAGGSVDDPDTPSTDEFGVGVSYEFGDFEVMVAFERQDPTVLATPLGETDVIFLQFNGSAGAISYDVFYHQADSDVLDVAGYGASVDFAAGDITWTVAVGDTDVDDDDPDFGVGFELDLGGGLAFSAGIGSAGVVDEFTVADAGFTMAF